MEKLHRSLVSESCRLDETKTDDFQLHVVLFSVICFKLISFTHLKVCCSVTNTRTNIPLVIFTVQTKSLQSTAN